MKHVISASRMAFVFALLVGLLVTESPAQEAAAQVPQRYIVVLSSGASPQAVAQDHALQTEYIYRHALNGFSAIVPPGRLTALQRDPRVAFVEADQPAHIFVQTVPTGIQRIFASSNVELDIDGSDDYRVDVDVAVIDTGIDFDHPDLNVVFRTNCAKGGPFNQSCTDGDGDDGNGHGTHVAGTIAAIDNNVGVVGVAPGARLWAIKVLKDDGSGWISWIIAGIDRVTALKDYIEVANMSLGCECSSIAMDIAIANSVDAGVAYAVAAGNSNKDAVTFSPANHPDVLTVSALADFDGVPGGLGFPTCRSDQDDTLADFSNWGSTIEITAPGVCILSTWKGGGYNTISGTSMASPHAAGALALLASINNPSDDPSVKALYQTLKNKGNFNWTDDSGDGTKEPLLDVSDTTIFNPVLVAGSGGGSNTSPTANNASATTNEDTTVAIALSGSDAELCELTFSIVTGPTHGTLGSITNNACVSGSPNTDSASVTYTPNANFNGSDSFTYKVNDGSVDSNVATASITVNAVNDGPVANGQSVTTQKNTQKVITLTGSDVDGCAGQTFSFAATGPAHGGLSATSGAMSCSSGSLSADVTYTPTTDYTGSDSFPFTISDGTATSNTATVSITVSDQATKMHVGDLDGSSTNQGSTWTAIVSITVHDANENPVADATVSGTITYNGNSTSVSCLTDNSGQCSVSKSGIPKKNGSATFTVSNVTHQTLPYDANANHDPDGDSNGTSIAVNKP